MAREIFPGVVSFDDGRILTKNLAPGQRVYGEELHTVEGDEFRAWDPTRSKLGAYILKGGKNFPFDRTARVLYLGAANGTTPSHVSDIVRDGIMVAVEFSPRSFRDLLRTAQQRPNMVPVLADAWRPELYERYLGHVDVVFQDISQRQQAQIFAKNVNRFKPKWAIIAVKARSVNVAAHPREVYDQVGREVEELTGYGAVEMIDLGPYERDHAAIVFRSGAAKQSEPRQEVRAERRGEDRPVPRDDRQRSDRPRDDRPRDDRPRGGGGRPGAFNKSGPPKRDDRPQRWDKPPREDRAPPRDRPSGGPERRKWK